jgi:hypothetical protein
VLCDVHHRARFFGIHEITGPVWGPQHILRDDFIAKVRPKSQSGNGPTSDPTVTDRVAPNQVRPLCAIINGRRC